jgi:hypothetical protein
MNEERYKQTQVEMTLEEAADLFHKGYSALARDNPCRNTASRFQRELHFIPDDLSELVRYIVSENIDNLSGRSYSSGKVYVARKRKGKIEIFRPEIDEIKDKKGKRNLIIDTLFESRKGVTKDGCYTPSFAVYANPYLSGIRDPNELCGKKLFELEEDGRATQKEISELPIWDKPEDYEKFLEFVYGVEGIPSDWRISVVNQEDTNKRPKLFTTCLNTDKNYVHIMDGKGYVNHIPFDIDMLMGEKKVYSEPWPKPILQRIDSEESGKLLLRGDVRIPKEYDILEGYLMDRYVQQEDLSDGIVVMNKDRIPKYLKRRLRL